MGPPSIDRVDDVMTPQYCSVMQAKRTTRQHKSGNSYSIRVPRDMAFADPNQELEIEKRGDALIITRKRLSLDELFAELDKLPKPVFGDEVLERPDVRDPWDPS